MSLIIMSLIVLLLALVILGIVFWAVQQLTMPQPVRVVVTVVLAIVAIVWLAQAFGVSIPGLRLS